MGKQKHILGITALILAGLYFASGGSSAQDSDRFTIGRLKYSGGGDWYANPSSLPNLLKYLGQNTNLNTAGSEVVVSLTDDSIFQMPIIYITGHGNIRFSQAEANKLRRYLKGGGFLFIDDNYGLDKHIRREMLKVFPKKKFRTIPSDHAIYSKPFAFPRGLPKIHEHDGTAAQGYGMFYNGRLVVYYSFSTDLGDGWEDYEVHKNPPAKREAALKMGVNVIIYALSQGLR